MGSLTPSPAQVGCMLRRLCHAWQSFGADGWPLVGLQGAILLLPTSVAGTSGASVLLPKVYQVLQESARDPVDQSVQGSIAGCPWC